MAKIKIISGWSNPGGSTTSFINLCNLFNENGIVCTFYGPHDWHLDKCKSGRFSEAQPLDPEDTVIMHFFRVKERPPVKKFILSCHEKGLFPIKSFDNVWDEIVFVSESQRKWQGVDGTIIPNIISPIIKTREDDGLLVAGIIGSIDRNKQPHVSIKRALEDGCNKVLLFGRIMDNSYWEEVVSPLLVDGVVEFVGHVDCRDELYSQVDVVYQSSISECASLVASECFSLGIPFKGNENMEEVTGVLDRDTIFEKWVDLLEV